MRENRLYGSEGGAGVLSLRSYPYPKSIESLRRSSQRNRRARG